MNPHPPASVRALDAWKNCQPRPVWPDRDVHALHSYFNTCPESPDGRYVLLFIARQADAELGDLCLLDRRNGETRVLDRGIEVEDAHRQANQQWLAGGRYVVYMRRDQGHWRVMRADVASGEVAELAHGRQAGWGPADGTVVPLYGSHWEPGLYHDIELLDVVTGSARTVLDLRTVLGGFPAIVQELFPDRQPDSLFFPVLSPDGRRVIFKLSAVLDGRYRSEKASRREGLFAYDLVAGRALGFHPTWGHPAWLPDSHTVLRNGLLVDTDTMATRPIPWYPLRLNTHPAASPDGELVAMDVLRAPFTQQDGHWTVVIGDLSETWLHLHTAPAPGNGTASWRSAHPHPVFSADGCRLYFNVNLGERTVLYVAERKPLR